MTKRLLNDKRDLRWDMIKAVAIFLVVLGHCIQTMDLLWQQNVVQRVIYSFHMPLFMFVSGYFAVNSKSVCFRKWIIDKSRRLLVPCIVHGVFFSAAMYFFARTPQPLPDVISVLNTVWYLFVLFLLLLFARIFDFIPWTLGRMAAWCALYAIGFLVDLEPDAQYLVGMMPFFLVGRWLRKSGKEYPSTVILMLLSFIYVLICSQWTFENAVYYLELGRLLFAVKQLIILYSCGFCGLSFVLLVFKYLPTQNIVVSVLANVGQRTLDIYVLQIYAILLLKRFGPSFDSIVYHLVFAIVVTLFCFIVSSFIRKNVFLSQLILGARI